jgi:hypothetical protein
LTWIFLAPAVEDYVLNMEVARYLQAARLVANTLEDRGVLVRGALMGQLIFGRRDSTMQI